jgi:prepilin-type processing-associated H-X9-DG protein
MALEFEVPEQRIGRKRARLWPGVRRSLVVVVLCLFIGPVLLAAWPAVRASRRATCVNHLHALGLAFQNYHDAYEHFPAPAMVGSDGNPLLSWRVALLPQLGQRDLYEQFRKDEPWNSPHNLALLPRMPAVFACPSEPDTAQGLSTYLVVVGPKAGLGVIGSMFEPGRGVDLRELMDGTSNTLMVAESGRPVPWTKPDEIPLGDQASPPSFGSRHEGGFNVLFADGSVQFLKFTISRTVLWGLLTRDGGEVLSAG